MREAKCDRLTVKVSIGQSTRPLAALHTTIIAIISCSTIMSDRSDNSNNNKKKRKGADGGAVPVKVESSSSPTAQEHQQQAPMAPAPRDHSKLTPIQQLLRVELRKDDANVVKDALRNLVHLCVPTANNNNAHDNRAAVTAAGGAFHIPVAMEKWSTNPAIQAEGCRALENASCRNEKFKQSGKESGTIDAIIWAMKEHPSHRSVQRFGCGALGNFISSVDKSNAEYVVKECNGVELIVAAMNHFKDDAKLQENASRALNNLLAVINNSETKDAIVKGGGGRALWDAIENHKDESEDHVKDLQVIARSTLKKLL